MCAKGVDGRVRACREVAAPRVANYCRIAAASPAKPRTTPFPAAPRSPIPLLRAPVRDVGFVGFDADIR